MRGTVRTGTMDVGGECDTFCTPNIRCLRWRQSRGVVHVNPDPIVAVVAVAEHFQLADELDVEHRVCGHLVAECDDDLTAHSICRGRH